ncbi:MAG: PEP-CTERM sorting domain-containing protein [Armatimonadota bacterium]|nr:PEP-CTERM sorting domain-containing protein [Armatimonadota bacterium]
MTRAIKRMTLASLVLAASLAVSAVFAQTWSEVGDAGDMPGTAQVVTGTGPLTTIFGTITPGSGIPYVAPDADLYKIYISDPANFSASTVNAATTMDTHLFLFRSDGTGVYANEDFGPGIPGMGVPQSLLPSGHPYSPISAGEYFLGIAGYRWDPVNADGNMFTENQGTYQVVSGPNSPNPITGWGGLWYADYGTYRIDLTGAQYIPLTPPPPGPVPEPSTLALLGLGLASFARRRRR